MGPEFEADIARIEALTALGRHEDAARHAAEAVTREPDNAWLHAAWAEAMIEFDPLSAVPQAQRALGLAPDQPEMLRTLVRAQWRAGGTAHALESVERLRAMAPGMAEAHTWRAALLVSSVWRHNRSAGVLADAAASAREGLRLAPTWPNANLTVGRIHLLSGDARTAQLYIDQTLQLDPNYAPAHELLGDLHRIGGNVRAASDAYVRAGRADPTSDATGRLRQLLRPDGDNRARFLLAFVLLPVLPVAGVILVVQSLAQNVQASRNRRHLTDDANQILDLDDRLR